MPPVFEILIPAQLVWSELETRQVRKCKQLASWRLDFRVWTISGGSLSCQWLQSTADRAGGSAQISTEQQSSALILELHLHTRRQS